MNDIVLDHPSVSRCHAILRYSPSGVTLECLGATHGTFLLDATQAQTQLAAQTPVELQNGQGIVFGASSRSYVLNGFSVKRSRTPEREQSYAPSSSSSSFSSNPSNPSNTTPLHKSTSFSSGGILTPADLEAQTLPSMVPRAKAQTAWEDSASAGFADEARKNKVSLPSRFHSHIACFSLLLFSNI
jgi:pSer/pThr/pTyr-binding forkhead associated (FHA) protein